MIQNHLGFISPEKNNIVKNKCFQQKYKCPDPSLDETLPKKLRDEKQHILDLVQGELTWQQYLQEPRCFNKNHVVKKVKLYNSDFVRGTIRLRKNNAYVFSIEENIEFNPRSDNDYRPDNSDPEYKDTQYLLDFFAAITVENTAGTVILGNGHTLRQSKAHFLKQPFIQLIELASQPFMPGQGPAQFGTRPVYGENIYICNLHLGFNSHEGIHSNLAKNVLIENVTFSDHTVAAAAFNGAQNLALVNCHSLHNLHHVPVNALWTAARFLFKFVDYFLSKQGNDEFSQLRAALEKLKYLWNQAFDDLMTSPTFSISEQNHAEAYKLFGKTGPLDGQGYGFLIFGGAGVAVNGFLPDRNTVAAHQTHDIVFLHCSSERARFTPVEHTALANRTTGKVQQGTTGESLRVRHIVDHATGMYVGDALSDVHILFADALATLQNNNEQAQYAGVMNIEEPVRKWALSVLKENQPQMSLAELLGPGGGYKTYGNSDFQFHVLKGAVGIRMDGVTRAVIRDFKLDGCYNDGAAGEMTGLPGQPAQVIYSNSKNGGHPLQNSQKGYCGANSHGICLSACDDVLLENIKVFNVKSKNGNAVGIDVQYSSENITMQNINVCGVTSDVVAYPLLPHPIITNIHVDDSSKCKNCDIN